MAQITLYAKTAGNWDVANAWNDQAGGGGTDYTNPQNGGGNTYICILNSKAMVLSATCGDGAGNVTVDQVNAPAADTGTLATSGAHVLTANVTYGHTLTAGMIQVLTGDTLQITGIVTNTGAGYAVVTAGTGIVTLTNAGGTVISQSSTGRGLSTAGTGAATVTGTITNTTGGYGLYQGSSSAAHTISGAISNTGSNGVRLVLGTTTWTPAAGTSLSGSGCPVVYCLGGNWVIDGIPAMSITAQQAPLQVYTGTVTWIATGSLAASAECQIDVIGAAGVLALATAGGSLTLTNSGTVVIRKLAGTLTTTSGANTASIVLATSTSYAAIPGGSDANKAIITGPTLPAAGDVDDTAGVFGYAGTPITPTCLLPLEADTKLAVQYGAGGVEFTGTLAAAGVFVIED